MERLAELAPRVSDLFRQDPWYSSDPARFFFESFVLSVMHELSGSRSRRLDELNLPDACGSRSADWEGVLREIMDLSVTIDIAILNGWYILLERAGRTGEDCDAIGFARNFVDRYFSGDSNLDKWTPDSLDDACRRIERIRSTES